MTTHLMIVHPRYLAPILSGVKNVEARLGIDRRAPFGRVTPGETVFIKPTGQRVLAKAIVRRVDEFEDLTPDAIRDLRETYDDRIMGGDMYWNEKRNARFATLITLERPALIHSEASVPDELLVASRSAWRMTEREPLRSRKAA
jgi:ASC-1-like (ASCH) protein